MAALVTLARAKQQLHIPVTTTERDVEVQALINRASALVITHLKSQAVAAWSVEDPLPAEGIAVPGGVEIATLLLIASLDEHRGDDETPAADLWKSFLIPFRDPALA